MTEPVLSAVLLNDSDELKRWSRKNFGFDFLRLFRVCKNCGRVYGYHCQSHDECPTSQYKFGNHAKKGDFETEKTFDLDKEITIIFMVYLVLIGVKFET